MNRLRFSCTIVLMPVLLVACGDATRATDPSAAAQLESKSLVGGLERQVQMMDACEPESFNAAIGPGTCSREGGVTFANFLSLLGKHQTVGAWHFAPSTLNVRVGQELVAINKGGEAHTFTEVAAFGGGIVPVLNDLSGTPVPAPECLALTPDDFVPPGGTHREVVDEAGTELYECCLHPWMRAVVTARE